MNEKFPEVLFYRPFLEGQDETDFYYMKMVLREEECVAEFWINFKGEVWEKYLNKYARV